MRMPGRYPACWLLCLLLLAGCAAAGSPPPGGGKRLSVDQAEYDPVWLATLQAMTKNFDIKELDKARGFIKASQSHWSFGEFVTVSITPPAPPGPYLVEVVSTRTLKDYRRWDQEVVNAIRGNLERKGNKRLMDD